MRRVRRRGETERAYDWGRGGKALRAHWKRLIHEVSGVISMPFSSARRRRRWACARAVMPTCDRKRSAISAEFIHGAAVCNPNKPTPYGTLRSSRA